MLHRKFFHVSMTMVSLMWQIFLCNRWSRQWFQVASHVPGLFSVFSSCFCMAYFQKRVIDQTDLKWFVCCSQGFSVKTSFFFEFEILISVNKNIFTLWLANEKFISDWKWVSFSNWNSFNFNVTYQYWENLPLLQHWQLWHKFATCCFNLKAIIQPKSYINLVLEILTNATNFWPLLGSSRLKLLCVILRP